MCVCVCVCVRALCVYVYMCMCVFICVNVYLQLRILCVDSSIFLSQVRYEAAKAKGAFIEGEDKNGALRCVWTTGKISNVQETVKGATLGGEKAVDAKEAERIGGLFKNLGWAFDLDQKKAKALLACVHSSSLDMGV